MPWEILAIDEFAECFETLQESEQIEIAANVGVLREIGPRLGRPRVDGIKGSAFPNMKELRIQIAGEPWRILFAFDPQRIGVLLLGGNKGGDKRWYKTHIPIADDRYRRHLANLDD
ncbi:type II toxin-antitoxin system RelE/ParE family toxin [Tundrisphaera lichenicola]|uniref:type II toxin-antitoxin system RelE/ParE family toxin n=1 Tax=Tundrisphaera lichenicola TaxID=2029860 RepID=UPI003EBA499E